jgi:vacuolar protein sorting-associated protein 45
MRAQKGLFTFRQQNLSSLVLILDRRDDPVTPLLLPWTYQVLLAVVHTPLSIEEREMTNV